MRLYNIVIDSMKADEPVLDSASCGKISMMEATKTDSGEDVSSIENFFLLILYYYYLQNKESPKDIVYSGKVLNKTTGKGLNFKLTNLPEQLQKILHCYLRLISS